MTGNFQFVDDSFLIERTLKTLCALDDASMKKVAIDLGSLLGSAESLIKSTVQSQIHDSSHGGLLRTAIDFLAPAAFFRLFPGNPLVTGLFVVAQLLGYDLYTIFEKIVGPIIGKLKSGQAVSAQDVNEAGKAAIPGQQTAQASDDLLESLRDIDSRLTKQARGGAGGMDLLKQLLESQHTEHSSPLVRMFAFLKPARRGSLFVGILVWLIKTFLLSVGLLAGAKAITGLLGIKTPTDNPMGQTATETTVVPTAAVPVPVPVGDFAKPIELHGLQPYEMVLEWTFQKHPELRQYKDIVLTTPSFWGTVRDISKNWNPGQDKLIVPSSYKNIDDILNTFIKDVENELPQKGTKQ
jgi:hypothetical protein